MSFEKIFERQIENLFGWNILALLRVNIGNLGASFVLVWILTKFELGEFECVWFGKREVINRVDIVTKIEHDILISQPKHYECYLQCLLI